MSESAIDDDPCIATRCTTIIAAAIDAVIVHAVGDGRRTRCTPQPMQAAAITSETIPTTPETCPTRLTCAPAETSAIPRAPAPAIRAPRGTRIAEAVITSTAMTQQHPCPDASPPQCLALVGGTFITGLFSQKLYGFNVKPA